MTATRSACPPSIPFGANLTFEYDGVGNRTQVQDSFGGTISSTYDAANELQQRQFSDGTNTLIIDLTYTGTHNIASESYYTGSVGTGALAMASFLYDAADRITSIQNTSGALRRRTAARPSNPSL
jgi:hypothetical protein